MNQAEISKWGAIAAQLDDPFTEHVALLASHGLSPDHWNVLLEQIRGATDNDSKLQAAFMRAYGLVKESKRRSGQGAAVRGVAVQGVAARVVTPSAEPIDPGDVTMLPPIARVVPSYLQAKPVEIKEPPVAAALSMPATPGTPKFTAYAMEKESGPKRPTLPFKPVSKDLRSAPSPAAAPSAPPLPHPDSGATVGLPDGLPLGPAMPFDAQPVAPEAVDLSMFPLERYAEVTCALAGDADRATVLRRNVLTEGMWTAVANAWAQRVAADPATRERYFELVRTIRPGGR